MVKPATPKSSDELRAIAAEWCVKLHGEDATDEDRAQHRAWLELDPDHKRAYESVETTMTMARHVPRAIAPDAHFEAAERSRRPTHSWLAVAGIGALGILILGAVRPWFATQYKTAVGEHRQVMLSDGSTVQMNAASRISVRFAGGIRAVTLESGEALFSVAKDPKHPFQVHAGSRVIQAVGTAFDVEKHGGTIDLAVAEGTVAVSAVSSDRGIWPQSVSTSAVLVTYGHALSYAKGDALGSTHSVAIDLVASWQRGELNYEEVPLARLAVDLERQFGTEIVIEDPKLAMLAVTIALKLRDEEATMALLQKLLPVRVTRLSPHRIILSSP